MSRIKHIAAVPLVAILVSCSSVFEDRSVCDCILTVDISDLSAGRNGWGTMMSVVDPLGERSLKGPLPESWEVEGDIVTVHVPKREMLVSVAEGFKTMTLSSDASYLEMKDKMDSVLLHNCSVDCSGEKARDVVRLRKQWCGITVNLIVAGDDDMYSVEISGKWNGVSLHDFSPHKGDFVITPLQSGLLEYETMIPRQGDDSLNLKLFSKDKGELLYDCDLGAAMRQKGYDWDKDSLDDIIISLDCQSYSIGIEFLPWDEGGLEEEFSL